MNGSFSCLCLCCQEINVDLVRLYEAYVLLIEQEIGNRFQTTLNGKIGFRKWLVGNGWLSITNLLSFLNVYRIWTFTAILYSHLSSCFFQAWITEVDPAKASELYIESVHEANKDEESLSFTLSLRETLKERNRAILRFYKRPRVQWTKPLQCHLIGTIVIYWETKQKLSTPQTVLFK